MSIDVPTKRWIRNESDERAAAKGCKFDESRGQIVVDFISNVLCLYEGDSAGEPFVPLDWFYDVTMRVFGWVKFSEKWGRWIRRFNASSVWVPKKNGKSPGLAAWGLYLLAGDGEKGQKVYLAAKDGQQSREIAGKHAIEMCLASPQLMQVCTVNRTLMQITHEPTRSILKPISSNDARAQKSKEGLNGSILVDETHVVDQEFMNRISRAGISRSEPLQGEFSTVGNDPESYGHKRYEYGKRVESCIDDTEDLSFFFTSYEAPQDLTDAQLAEDPIKYGKLANPAWGHTVHAEEFMDDYNRSKVSITALADLKMYRLNIWQHSSNPWLDMGDWAACYEQYTANEMLGYECYAALDLAKVRDTCALVLLFKCNDDQYRQVPYFWVPRRRVDALRDKVRYEEWAQEGWVKITNGDTADYGVIRKDLIDLITRFKVRKLGYDDWYAEQLVQRLIEEDRVLTVEECVSFGQSMKDFAAPTDSYEAAVISHTIKHNGNKCMTWQASNVCVKQDNNGNKKPVKQKQGDYRSIDGPVAGIMVYEIATGSRGPSVYEQREMIVL